jgi:hypothetical protein
MALARAISTCAAELRWRVCELNDVNLHWLNHLRQIDAQTVPGLIALTEKYAIFASRELRNQLVMTLVCDRRLA